MNNAYVAQVAVFLRIIHAVPDNKLILDLEPAIIYIHLYAPPRWLVEQNAHLHAAGMAGAQGLESSS